MFLVEIAILAVALSADSFAVSLACGAKSPGITFRDATSIATVLAVCQGLMPLLGWSIGEGIKRYIITFDHWIAFGLLLYLGINMLINSKKEEETNFNIKSRRYIWTLGVATSIDALVVGFTYSISYPSMILLTVTTIAIFTFIFSLIGIKIGKYAGARWQVVSEQIGGSILILLGLKILITHLVSGI